MMQTTHAIWIVLNLPKAKVVQAVQSAPSAPPVEKSPFMRPNRISVYAAIFTIEILTSDDIGMSDSRPILGKIEILIPHRLTDSLSDD